MNATIRVSRLQAITKDSPVIDGLDVWDTLTGRENAPHPREDLLYWHGKTGFHAIRAGDWKLFLDREGARIPGDQGAGPALFNLAREVDELTDLSDKFPEKVREMKKLAEKRLADINKSMIPLGE